MNADGGGPKVFYDKLPIILQAETAECGLVCIAMVAAYFGLRRDLRSLRREFPISLKGANLSQLIKITGRLELMSRAVRADLDEVDKLRLPCILHWKFNHFVVLKAISSNRYIIHDPAHGIRSLTSIEFSEAFTGVALEVWPSLEFTPKQERPRLQLGNLMGRVVGLKRSLLHVLCLSIALEIFGILSPLAMQWVTDHVLVTLDEKLLLTIVLAFGISMVVQQSIAVIRSWCLMYLSATLSVQWKTNVFCHLLRLPVQFFERRHLGDIVSRFGAVDSIHQTLTNSLVTAVLDGLVTIMTIVVMVIYSAELTIVPLIAMLLYGFGRWLTYGLFFSAAQTYTVKSAKTQSHFLETIRGVKAIKLFQRQDERRATWLSLLVDQVNAGLKSQKLQMIYQHGNGFIFGLENLFVLYAGAHMVISGQFTIGMLVAFNAFKGQFNSRVAGLIDNFFSVKILRLQGERLADIVLHEPENEGGRDEYSERITKGRITATGVQYRYAHGEQTILHGVDMEIYAGESIAIVGPTGCGKTTLLNILLGIIKPTRGMVMIDGVDLEEIGVTEFRRSIGTILQDDALFAGSVAENICFFDSDPDYEKVIRCSISAGVHEEITAMPMGYNTLVGDMGSVLSGGQKQRVLLARALYREPLILFMDEATCHLDIDKEYEVLNSVKSLNITRIIIAHRRETLQLVDRVFLLQNGEVSWSGPPSLLPSEGARNSS